MRIAAVNQDRGIDPARAKGAAVHLAAMRGALAEAGAEVLALDEPDGRRLHERLEAAHAEGGVHAVYERYALGADSAGRFARAHGLLHVLEVNAPLLDEAALHRDASLDADRVAAERAVLTAPDVLLAVSTAVADWLVRQGVQRERVRVRPNAVDPRRFHAGLRAPRAPGAPLVLGFHGRLRPWHGFERLVAAIEELLLRGVAVRLETLGAGDFGAAGAARLPAGVWRHTDWVEHDEVPRHVARCDVLALTYPPDAPCYFSPLKLLEAMALGVVPVVPALGDLPQAVRHDVDGLVYEPGELAGLVELLAGLAHEPGRLTQLSEGARSRAGRHTWRALADEVVGLVRSSRVAGWP